MIDAVGQVMPFISPGWLGWGKVWVREAEAPAKAAARGQERDTCAFSPEALELSRQAGREKEELPPGHRAEQEPTLNDLSPAEQSQVEELRQRDREVKAHEQTHKAMLGSYAAGGPHYEYQTGPDNRRYAVGGSVDVDTGEENTPEKTIRKAQIIKRAALGVQGPSGADKAVAGQAAQMEQKARMELQQQQRQHGLGAYDAFSAPAFVAGQFLQTWA